MTKPKPQIAAAEFVHHAHPLSAHRTKHDNEQRAEQNINSEFLQFRLVTANIRRDKKSGGKPRGCNPKNSELRVPRSSHDIRQIILQRNSVKSAAFHAVMRRDNSHHNLQ